MEIVGHYNDLSEPLRKQLEERINSFGETVRYKFKIGQENPDPEKYNGKIIYPRQYTLDPAKYTIRDEQEKRQGKSPIKNVAIVSGVDEKGLANRFLKIRLFGNQKGVLSLKIKESEEDRATCMFLEMHPKSANGLIKHKEAVSVFERIDEVAYAKQQREERRQKKLATDRAFEMSDEEIVQFNMAMEWEEAADKEVMRQSVELFAENDPEAFLKLTSGKKIEYRSVINSALKTGKLLFDPAEHKLTDGTTKQVICTLNPNPQKTYVELIADWMETNGDKGDKAYKRLVEVTK